MKNKIILIVLFSLMVPNLAFASWWNPFTWFEEGNKTEIFTEISTSTPIIISEIEKGTTWWNPFSWSKKETFNTHNTTTSTTTTEETVSESENKDNEAKIQNTANEEVQLEIETTKAKTETEKYKLQVEQEETGIKSTQEQIATTDTSSINFDDNVIKSVLRLKIYDTISGQDISYGSGISIGGFGNILTNYHVVEKAIENPTRYQVYGCVTTSINTQCDYFNYLLSTTGALPGSEVRNPVYDKNLDLALVYVNQVYFDNKWSSVLDASFIDRTVNLSSYTKNYTDLNINDPVYSVGYPDYGGGKTIQVDGIVIDLIVDDQSNQPLIVSDFKISFGNSGGPVFNSKGELIGVTVQCFTDLNDKCVEGIFIPLPTVNWWYSEVNNSHITTWQGKNYYSSNNGIPDDTQKDALCILEGNAYYDSKISTNSCTCNTGYSKNTDGKCVNNSGVTTPPRMSYGKPANPEAEKKALQMLDSLFSDIKKASLIKNNYNPSILKANMGDEYRNKALYFAADGLKTEATDYLNNAISFYDEALEILGNDPPEEWKQSYGCLISSYNKSRAAAQILLLGVPYFKVSIKAADYMNEAQSFIDEARLYSTCAFNGVPI